LWFFFAQLQLVVKKLQEKFKAVFLHERAALRSAFQVLASADEGLGPALFIPAVQAVFPLSSRLALLAFAYLDRIGIKPVHIATLPITFKTQSRGFLFPIAPRRACGSGRILLALRRTAVTLAT
jgi:hypothetical protein